MKALAGRGRTPIAQACLGLFHPKPALWQQFAVLLTTVCLTGCVGVSSTTLPPRASALDCLPYGSSKTLTIGVKRHEQRVHSDTLIKTLRSTELFHQVAYLEEFSSPPSLVASVEEHASPNMDCPVPTLLTFGLIPTRTVEKHGQVFSLQAPGDEANGVLIDQRYQGTTTIGWVALFKALSPNETLLTPERHSRYREALRHTLMAHGPELRHLARLPQTVSLK